MGPYGAQWQCYGMARPMSIHNTRARGNVRLTTQIPS